MALMETRYCKRKGCRKAIPKINSKGKTMLPSNYKRRVTCSSECSAKERNELLANKRLPYEHREAIDFFNFGMVYKMRLT